MRRLVAGVAIGLCTVSGAGRPAALAVAQPAPADAGAPAAPARPLDALLAEVDGHTIAASDAALARALGVLGLTPSGGAITRDEVERAIDARLLAEEARRVGLTAGPEALAAAWTAAAAPAGGPAALEAWLDAHRVDRDWARALVEQDVLARQFIEQRFRAFVFVGESDIDAALGGAGGDADAREAARRRLVEAAVARALGEWLEAARRRARLRILLPPGGTAPLVLPMPPGSALRGGAIDRIVAPGHRGPLSHRRTDSMMTALQFIHGDLKRMHAMLDAALDLPPAQLHAVPGGQGKANTIAWELWHVARTEDNVVRFILQNRRPTVWQEGGYADKLGLPAVAQGTGMTTAEAQALRLRDIPLFREYMQKVWASTDEFLSSVDPAALEQPVTIKPLGEMPGVRALGQVCLTHGFSHVGEIELAKTLVGAGA